MLSPWIQRLTAACFVAGIHYKPSTKHNETSQNHLVTSIASISMAGGFRYFFVVLIPIDHFSRFHWLVAIQLAGPDSGLWSLQTSFYAECYGPLPLEFLEKLGEFQASKGLVERVNQFSEFDRID